MNIQGIEACNEKVFISKNIYISIIKTDKQKLELEIRIDKLTGYIIDMLSKKK